MTMVATAYETANDYPEKVIVEIIVAGFSGQFGGIITSLKMKNNSLLQLK